SECFKVRDDFPAGQAGQRGDEIRPDCISTVEICNGIADDENFFSEYVTFIDRVFKMRFVMTVKTPQITVGMRFCQGEIDTYHTFGCKDLRGSGNSVVSENVHEALLMERNQCFLSRPAGGDSNLHTCFDEPFQHSFDGLR